MTWRNKSAALGILLLPAVALAQSIGAEPGQVSGYYEGMVFEIRVDAANEAYVASRLEILLRDYLELIRITVDAGNVVLFEQGALLGNSCGTPSGVPPYVCPEVDCAECNAFNTSKISIDVDISDANGDAQRVVLRTSPAADVDGWRRLRLLVRMTRTQDDGANCPSPLPVPPQAIWTQGGIPLAFGFSTVASACRDNLELASLNVVGTSLPVSRAAGGTSLTIGWDAYNNASPAQPVILNSWLFDVLTVDQLYACNIPGQGMGSCNRPGMLALAPASSGGLPMQVQLSIADYLPQAAGDVTLSMTWPGPVGAMQFALVRDQQVTRLDVDAPAAISAAQAGQVVVTSVFNAAGGKEVIAANFAIVAARSMDVEASTTQDVTPFQLGEIQKWLVIESPGSALVDPQEPSALNVALLPRMEIDVLVTAQDPDPASPPNVLVTIPFTPDTATCAIAVTHSVPGLAGVDTGPRLEPGETGVTVGLRVNGVAPDGPMSWEISNATNVIQDYSAAATFDAPNSVGVVSVTARHGACPDGQISVALPVGLQCSVMASDTVLAPGVPVGLTLAASLGGVGRPVAAEGVQFELTPALQEIELQEDPTDVYHRLLLVREMLPEGTRIAIGAEYDACAEPPSLLELSTSTTLRLSLDVQPKQVEPGGLAQVTASYENRSARDLGSLYFEIELGAGLRVVRRLPRTSQAPARRVDCRGTSKKPRVCFELDADADTSVHTAALPILAAQSAGGATPTLSARAFFGAQSPGAAIFQHVLDEARATVVIREIPELSESTIFGKVFHDRNLNGEVDDDEPGVGGVMVALAAGVYVVTDAAGTYHIARLAPGRHVVKVNDATLPLGMFVTTAPRREVTLTPGMFTRVSFGVAMPPMQPATPLQFVAPSSTPVVVDGRVVYRAAFRGEPGRMLTGYHGGTPVVAEVVAGGDYQLPVGLDQLDDWTLVERDPDGRTWVYGFALKSYAREGTGNIVVPWGPRLLAQLILPAAGRPVAGTHVALAGAVLGRHALTLGSTDGQECTVEPGGGAVSFHDLRCDFEVATLLNGLHVRLDAGPDELGVDPGATRFTLPVQGGGSHHFFVGVAGARVSRDPKTDGEVDTWDAGTQFFYRGLLDGDTLVTAGADLRARDLLLRADGGLRAFGGFSARLFGHDPRRVFRDLDPEEYYPTYGDASVTVDEREAGGRFFLRLQQGDNYVKWGGVNTAIDDAEIGRYVRSLYGLGVRWAVGSPEDPLRLRAVAFGAQPDSLPARDELIATGSSLYFLSHRDVVEGSVRVTLEVLDDISGLPVRVAPLVEGVDYEVDYLGGRVSLDGQLLYRQSAGSLTSGQAGGTRARLLVEYEYLPSSLGEDLSAGARAVLSAGPLSIGVTGVGELRDVGESLRRASAQYWLVGGTARLDVGRPLQVRVELAHSDGGHVAMARSLDGGLSYAAVGALDRRAGSALLFEASSELGPLRLGLYGRRIDAGFGDSRAAGARLLQGGVRVDGDWDTATQAWGNVDYRESQPLGAPALVRNRMALGAGQRLGDLRLAVEGRHEAMPVESTRLDVLGGEVGYALSPAWEMALRRRQVVAGGNRGTLRVRADGETAAGLLVKPAEGWDLSGEAGMDDIGVPFARIEGGFSVSDDTRLYAGYKRASPLGLALDADGMARSGNEVVAGGRRTLADSTSLYAEQSLRVDGRLRGATRAVGGEAPLATGLRLTFGYERGDLERDDTLERLRRDAVQLGGLYGNERLTLRLLSDARLDDAGGAVTKQVGGQGRVDYRVTDALTLALGLRGASSYQRPEGGAERHTRSAWEGAVGFALRSLFGDTVNAFGRYALVYDRDREAAAAEEVSPYLTQTSHIAALAVVVRVVGPLDVGPKVVYRSTRIVVGPDTAKDDAVIGALRGDVHVTGSWDVSTEGRVCAAPGSRLATRYGALTEASLLAMEWLRVGAGYNFSEISTAGVQCDEAGAKGVFVRVEALY